MLFVPAGLSGECGGVFFQPAAMTGMPLSHSSQLIYDLIYHLASPGKWTGTVVPVQLKPTNIKWYHIKLWYHYWRRSLFGGEVFEDALKKSDQLKLLPICQSVGHVGRLHRHQLVRAAHERGRMGRGFQKGRALVVG